MREAWPVLFALLVGLPFAGALLAGRLRGRAGDAAAVGVSALVALLALGMIAAGGRTGVAVPLGGLAAVDRLAGRHVPLFGWLLDPLSSLVLAAVVVLGFACVLYSTSYIGPANREQPVPADRGRFYFWLLAFVGAMAGLVVSATLLQLFLFWELTTLCSWALIGFYDREHGALEAARKAFLMTAAGGLCLLAAVVTLLALTRSAGFDAFALLPTPLRATAAPLLLVLLLLGAWAKSAQVPFHTWLPDAMVAPSPVSAYLHAASMVNAGVYLVLRVVTASLPAGGIPAGIGALIGVMAAVTLAVSVSQFFFQTDLKRLLAFSTVSHLAWVMIGAALGIAGSVKAVQGAALHILAHGVGKGLLFLSAGALSYAAGTRRIADLSGVLRRSPVAAAGFLIGTLTVTGVPPFAGFWSKLLIVSGAVRLGGWGVAVAALLLAESVLAFGWFLWVGQKVFLGRPSKAVEAMGPLTPAIETALVLLMVLCLVVTLAALPLAGALQPATAIGPPSAVALFPGGPR
jgi:hydrogenase-4 component D